MKIWIYNNGYGWSFPIGNYRDKNEEPIWVKLKFVDGYASEPIYEPKDNGKDSKKICVNEGSFDKYIDKKGILNIKLSVFNYDLLSDIELTENNMMSQDGTRYQTRLSDGNEDMFGASTKIEENDLPFY